MLYVFILTVDYFLYVNYKIITVLKYHEIILQDITV